ncbi:MAG: family 10 glycosylhydrolase [Bacilli bacterium]|nr:family 10 glycosylhydrolase [Bacilli bacterium]
MKNLIKLFVCLTLVIVSMFTVINSNTNKAISVDADSNLVAIKDDSGNTVTYRNTSDPIMRLKEYNYPTQNLRACWVSNFISSLPSYSTEEKWKADYSHVLDVMETYGLNCIIFHVRTHNNALYKSELNPVASWFSKVNFDEFDPLEWAIEETHKRGIEFHAWLNPYRISTNGANTQFVSGSIPAVNPVNDSSNLLQSGDSIILNPGLQSNRDFIVDSCMEVVENYDVDAIHFDDYFYISGVETNKSDNWKREQVDLFIEDLSNQLREYNKENNKAVQLGISPSGIYRNGGVTSSPKYDANGNLTSPLASNTGGFAHYGNYLYSDTLKWINEEWIDYIMPQTYWSLEQTVASFGELSRWWSWTVRYKKVNLYLGMGIYMPASNSNWCKNKYEVRDQILNAEMYDEVGGFSFYSYNYLESSNVYTKTGMDIVKNDYFSKKIPADVKKYYAPLYDTVPVENIKVANDVLSYDACDNVRGYVVYKVAKGETLDQNNIDHVYYYGNDLSVELDDTLNYSYYVSSVNLANEISEPISTEAATATAENVIEKINSLPKVIKLEHEALVQSVRGFYYALTETERAKVTNYNVLEAALELLQEKHNAMELTTAYKDLNLYTVDTQSEMKKLITSTKVQIDECANAQELLTLMNNFKKAMDAFKVLAEELAEPILTAKTTLNNHYNGFELDYYESQDQKDLKGVLDNALLALEDVKSQEEITDIVDAAILEMNQVPNFKADYNATIKEIEDTLDSLIKENIEKNEWFAKRNLNAKKGEIVNAIKSEPKFRVYMNDNEYISNAKKDFNAYISELNSLYSKVKAVISTFNSYDNTIEGAKELIDEYIQKVELAESKEQIDELKVEFREAYDKLKDKKSSGCSFGVINFINLFAVISMAIFVFKKK